MRLAHSAALIAGIALSFTTGCFDPIIGSKCAEDGLSLPECRAETEPCVGADCTPDDDPITTEPWCTGPDCTSVSQPGERPTVDPPQCADGDCPERFGHVILIGHDYASHASQTATINRILGNAVFIARGAMVNVAIYRGNASRRALIGAGAAIDQVAGELGREWQAQTMPRAFSAPTLDDVDVFLILSQGDLPGGDDALTALGEAWQPALEQFTRDGGVVISLDGRSANAGTVQILAAAGLVGNDSCAAAASQTLNVVSPTDALGVGLPVTYAASGATRFEGASEGVVVSDGVGPVVVHLAN